MKSEHTNGSHLKCIAHKIHEQGLLHKRQLSVKKMEYMFTIPTWKAQNNDFFICNKPYLKKKCQKYV